MLITVSLTGLVVLPFTLG